jgi:multicomponent K+:H+ antiporter subunit E
MKKLLPYPWMSAGLFVLWLLLNGTVSPGQILLGILVAVIGGWALVALDLPVTYRLRPGIVLRLATVVITDIVKSNIAVARIVLGLGRPQRRSGFVRIPLALRDPYGLATLAGIITSTPGTLWVGFEPASGTLTIHVLDLVDEAEWVRTIKSRYEGPLMEIFS